MKGNGNEREELEERFLRVFGATYEVVNGSPPHSPVIEQTVATLDQVRIIGIQQEVRFRINAFSGEKGNTVFLTIPLEGLKVIVSELESRALMSRLAERLK